MNFKVSINLLINRHLLSSYSMIDSVQGTGDKMVNKTDGVCILMEFRFQWERKKQVVVQSLSHVQLHVTPWTTAHQASLSITNSRSFLKLRSIESVMPSDHLILCRPLLLLPSIFLSIRVFSSESVLHIRWPNYWSFSFSINPSSEYSGLISFRIDWFDLLAAQRTLESLLQHYSPKAAIFSTLPCLWFNCHIHT